MTDRHEMFATVLNPFHRVPEFARAEGDEIIFRIEFAARAETAADVEFDVIHRLFRQVHHLRHGLAVEERQFCRTRDAEFAELGIPFGQQAAGFHRKRRLPLRVELVADHIIGGCECRFRVALVGIEHGRRIGLHVLEQEHLVGHGSLALDDRRQGLDVEHDRSERVLGDFGRVGQHHGDGLAVIAHLVTRDDGLRVRTDGRIGATERNRRDVALDVAGGDNRAHTRHGQRGAGIDVADAAMGDR